MGQASSMIWQEQLRQALRTTSQLGNFLGKALPQTPYPLLIPLPLAEKIRQGGEGSPLWLQFVPHSGEAGGEGLSDPIGDHHRFVGGRLIHRYPNRVLFLPTTHCPVLCRYCFRKNELAQPDDMFSPDSERTEEYLREHPEIEEIIFSGGDPFILSNERLRESLHMFTRIPSLKYLRFHTRTPVVLPERFDDSGLMGVLRECVDHFDLVTVVVHFNHEEEVDEAVELALEKMRDLSLHLTSQSVLLRGVNDSVPILKQLFVKMASMGLTPYYLHHPDKVLGGEHFYISREEGRAIYAHLRREAVGQVLPHYVVELPEGEGKVLAA